MKEYIRGGLLVLGWLLILGAAGGMDCGTLGFGAAAAAALCGLGLMAGATIAERRKDR
jgi:hypothetical protein